MTDLATLGFAVDSSPLARAKAEMQGMVPAARSAAAAVDGLTQATTKYEGPVGAIAAAANRAGISVEAMRARITATSQAVDAQSATITRLTNEYRQLSTIQNQINAATGVSGGFGNGAELLQQGQALDALRAKYNPLFAAQRQYKQELIDIRSALRQGAISEKEYADAIMNTKTAFTAQVNSIRGVTDRDNFFDKSAEGARRTGKAMQGLSFDARNLSFQLVDVAQGLAMGQSPMMIFAQQAGQIGQIAATSEKGIKGLFAEIGSGIAKVLTPMRLLTVGVLGLGIGLIALVKNAVDSSKAMDDLAKSINTTRSLLHGLEQVAGGRGISTDDFAAGMKSFGDQVYLAKRNMGDLVGLLRANGMGPAKNLQDAMQKVADLVARTKDDQQAQKVLVEAGLPANEQWVRYMRDLAKGIDNATASTVKFSDAAEQNMIAKARKFDQWWNESTTKLVNGFKAAAISIGDALTNIKIPDWLSKLLVLGSFAGTGAAGGALIGGPLGAAIGGIAGAGVGAASLYANGTGESSAPTRITIHPDPTQQRTVTGPAAKTREELLHDNALAQQRISLLGDLATVDDQVKQKELELGAAWLQSGIGVGKYRDAVLNAVRAQAEMSRVQQQASIGVFDLDAANKAAADTLQMWIDKKLLDPKNADQMAAATETLSKQMRSLSDSAKIAATPFEGLQRLINEGSNLKTLADGAAVSGLNGVSNALTDMATGATSAADGFKNMSSSIIRAITDMIVKITIITPLARTLQSVLGGIGGGGGIFSTLFGGAAATTMGPSGLAAIHHAGGVAGGGNVMRSVMPAMFLGAPRYHNGGIAGLAPDEVPAILQRGERVLPRGASNDNNAGPTINIINQSSGQVEQGGARRNADGSFDIFIRDAVRNVMADDASKNGPISQGMTARMRGFNGQ